MTYISRGRDIRALLKTHGEKAFPKALVMLAEDNVTLQQEIADLRKVIGGVLVMMQNITGAMGGFQTAMQEIEKKFRPNVEMNDDVP